MPNSSVILVFIGLCPNNEIYADIAVTASIENHAFNDPRSNPITHSILNWDADIKTSRWSTQAD